MRKVSILLAAGLCTVAVDAAEAHKLKVFATAVGSDISGYAYFVPGSRAQDVDVIVSLPDGKVVSHVRTNDLGEFHFDATTIADHKIQIDAGDGHETNYTVTASEISAVAAPADAVVMSTPATTVASPMPANADIAPMIEQAVARQLRPLREQIDAWQEKIWFHDVLGGLGYIIGIAGLFYGLTGTLRARGRSARRGIEEAKR